MKIFLIGFMGSGKTFWGKQWAENTGYDFYDIDEMIEQDQGKTIEKIFGESGEKFFRDLETNKLLDLPRNEKIIIATGGGSACFNDNISLMNETGITVYLRSSPKKILERLQNQRHKRPLVQHLKETEIELYTIEKIKEREFFYKQAQIILDVDELPKDYLPEFLKL